MSQVTLKQFQLDTDTGSLDLKPGEYESLQNIRGYGGLGTKRQGVQPRLTLSYGVMGMCDLKVDGDPTSPDRILVVDANGSFILYDYSEFLASFAYLFATGIKLNLQSPDLNWWALTVNSSTGAINVTGIAAPTGALSADQSIRQDELYGFAFATGIWRLSVVATGLGTPSIQTREYALSSATTTYSTAVSFNTGYGPVFQDDTGTQRWRLSIANGGATQITSI